MNNPNLLTVCNSYYEAPAVDIFTKRIPVTTPSLQPLWAGPSEPGIPAEGL